ncbi:MAG: CoA transferase, partial [Desulfuromonadales bacterium]|nr:CoA transferase [Desulfuromonadales bacterium]NIS40904.1 CoA transferase [Desulfuromonadales bacterium]
ATSKLSLGLDMRNPASKEVVERIIDWADLVFENFSPGTMDRMGVGWDVLSARKPSIIMASGSIFGQTGPLGSLGGSEVSGSAWSGRVSMTGDADRPPVLAGLTYGDSV